MTRRTLIWLMVLILWVFGSAALGEGAALPAPAEHTVTIGLSYQENMLVNTYDVVCYMDDAELFTLSQGEHKVFSLSLADGKHVLSLVGQNKSKSADSVEIDVAADVCFSIECKAKWTGLAITGMGDVTGQEKSRMQELVSLWGNLKNQVVEWFEK